MSVQFRSVMTESGKGRFLSLLRFMQRLRSLHEKMPLTNHWLVGTVGIYGAPHSGIAATEKNLVLPVKNVKLFAPNVRS